MPPPQGSVKIDRDVRYQRRASSAAVGQERSVLHDSSRPRPCGNALNR